MEIHRRHFGAGLLLGVLGTLLLLLLLMLVIAYSGSYNIAASTGHTAGLRWWIDTTMHASVRQRADDGDALARLAAADVGAGAAEFKAMCQHCHGGPGIEPAGWSRDMLPRPPHLSDAAAEWQPHEIFWILQHGLKYTGMPAFGETHDAATLWNITAFVERLPAMTPAEYRALGSSGHAHEHGGHGGGEGGHDGGNDRGDTHDGKSHGGNGQDDNGHADAGHRGGGHDDPAAQADPPGESSDHDHDHD